MRHFTKLLYSIVFILFLCSVFILFAAIQNALAKSILPYLSIFTALITGSLLYSLAMQKQERSTLLPDTQNQTADDKILETSPAQSSEETASEEETQIDTQKLLPSRTLGIEKYMEELLQNMANPFNIVQGLVYLKNPNEDLFQCFAQYAYFSENKPVEFRTGESLSGQAVKNKVIVTLSDIPDKYMTIASGLGKSNPKHLIFIPLKSQDEVVGLIEYATFGPLTDKQYKALESISKKVADTIIKHLKK